MVHYGALWLQAYMSGADVSAISLIGMILRQVKPRMIVTAKIMGRQAGLNIDRHHGMSTARLEAHFLAGGDVTRVLHAIIAANRAGIDLDFDRAAAIDLPAGTFWTRYIQACRPSSSTVRGLRAVEKLC